MVYLADLQVQVVPVVLVVNHLMKTVLKQYLESAKSSFHDVVHNRSACVCVLHLDVRVGRVAQVGQVMLRLHQKKIVLKQNKTQHHHGNV